MKTNVIRKITTLVLCLAVALGAVPVFAGSQGRDLDDGTAKTITAVIAPEMGINHQYDLPSPQTADLVLDPVADKQLNELWYFRLIKSGPYAGCYNIVSASRTDSTVNRFYGVDGKAGDVAKLYTSDAFNKRGQDADLACIVRVVSKGNGCYLIKSVFDDGLVLDNYFETKTGSYIRWWYEDGTDSQLWYINDVSGGAGSNNTNNEKTGIVRVNSSLNMRSSVPSGSVIARLANGTEVTILDGGAKTSGFYHISVYGLTGYASAGYITVSSGSNSVPSLSASTKMSTALYGGAGGRISCGFDGYQELREKYGYRHEGIDFKCGSGSNIYSLTDGVVTKVTKGSSSNLSTVAVYDEAADKTVVYLHLAPSSSLTAGSRVSAGTFIGTEAARGASGVVHTHVEVRDGRRTAAAVSKDKTLVNSDPTAYWNSKGYTVE